MSMAQNSKEDSSSSIILSTLTEIKSELHSVREDLDELKVKIYDPDNGLYARIKEIDTKSSKHQIWFDIFGKLFWVVLGSGATLLFKVIFGL